jgi:hypothetical protein
LGGTNRRFTERHCVTRAKLAAGYETDTAQNFMTESMRFRHFELECARATAFTANVQRHFSALHQAIARLAGIDRQVDRSRLHFSV